MSLSLQKQSLSNARDLALLNLIRECGALSIHQIRSLMFDFKSGYRVASRRLLVLRNLKLINCGRALSENCLVYYHQRPKQIDHILGVNWVRCWLHRQPWSTLKAWIYTPDYGMIIPDAEALIYDVPTGKNRAVFVEFDRDTAPMDKIALYNRFYEGGDYRGAAWAQGSDARFPEVLIVTVNRIRARCIEGLIEMENKNGIRFKVRLLEEIRGECMGT